MKKNSTWNDLLKPVVVLTVICIVVSAALAAVNGITAPIIAEAAAKAADAARYELLPEADGFEEIEVEVEGVTSMHKATNGVGYVIAAQGNGYGGNGSVKLMIAYDNDGNITNITVTDCSGETPGIGDKIVKEAWFMEQFLGLNGEAKKGENVDTISGTTISSGAALNAVNAAYKAFSEKALGVVIVELTFEEKVAQYFGNMVATEVAHEDVLEAYTSDLGLVLVTEGKGNGIIGDEHQSGLMLKAYTSFDENGVITGVMFDVSSETPGLGDKIAEADYINKFIGATDDSGADIIANCTYSSKGAKQAVNKAAAAFAAING
ncbi:MAG: FMN-binding protein [Oscillospiraceae bacterium]|nr:FMN-binding protein [Oscillospiraceae bacterium]MBQ6896293.1 FMN-binding protein [Oscillospiraceae bacterium]